MKEALLCGYPSCVPLLWATDSRHCVLIRMKQETCILLRCRESAVFTQGSSLNPDAVVGVVHRQLPRERTALFRSRKRKERKLCFQSVVLYYICITMSSGVLSSFTYLMEKPESILRGIDPYETTGSDSYPRLGRLLRHST